MADGGSTSPTTHRVWPLAWFHAHPMALDLLIAAAFLALSIVSLYTVEPSDLEGYSGTYRPADAGAVLLVIGMAVPLVFRRREPRLMLFVNLVFAGTYLVHNYLDSFATFGSFVAMYSMAAYTPRRQAYQALGWSLFMVVTLMVAGVFSPEEQLSVALIPANVAMFVTAFAVGFAVRSRRELVEELRLRAETAERQKVDEARRAVGEERARIAREMHDIVAHSLSVMVVQAGAARRVMARDPDQARRALEQIERSGREAMAEVRRTVGVLRAPGGDGADGPALAPQPRLADVVQLVEAWRVAGLPVELVETGDAQPLPPGVDLAAYRIVQEALTNTAKHAGTGAVATVHVHHGDGEVDVEVVDDGLGAAAPPPVAPGHGLTGMVERAALFGGTLDVGPRPGGGFRVHARLPVDGAVPSVPATIAGS